MAPTFFANHVSLNKWHLAIMSTIHLNMLSMESVNFFAWTCVFVLRKYELTDENNDVSFLQYSINEDVNMLDGCYVLHSLR